MEGALPVKQSKTLLHTFLFFIFIFLAALAGLPTAYGYLHPADPLILLAALLLPAPHALLAAGFGSVLADVFKGFYLLAPVTLALKLLMVLAARALLHTRAAQKHPECMILPAFLIPVAGYYLAEAIALLIGGEGSAAFLLAAGTLRKDLIQAAASALLFILIYDIYKGVEAGRAEFRRQNKEQEEEGEH